MAMTSCVDCGGPASDQAATCPHCGAPDPTELARARGVGRQRAHFWWVVVAVLLLGLGVFGYEVHESNQRIQKSECSLNTALGQPC